MLTDWPEISAALAGRVVFLARGLDGGGAQRDSVLLANELQRRSRPSAIASLEARGHLVDLVDPAVPVVDLGRGRKLRIAFALPALRRLLRARPAALVTSEPTCNTLAIVAASGLPEAHRPRLIAREVASPLQARDQDPYWQNRLAYRFLARRSYPRADLVLSFTEGARTDLAREFAVPDGRLVSFGTNAVLTADMRARIATLGRRPESGLIVSIGRLSPEKGFDGLIEAFALLAPKRPEARLVIVGEGAARPGLERLIAVRGLGDRVTLAGHMPDPLPVLARAALYVCASLHEGFGNALVEAMACGVPVVSTDAPYGPREILRGGALGALVQVGDPQALATAMGATLGNPPNSAALQARAADFTVEAAGRRFLEILDSAGVPDPRRLIQPSAARPGEIAPVAFVVRDQ